MVAREVQVYLGTWCRCARPLAGNDLRSGEEVQSVGTVGVGVSEQRGFPPAEGIGRRRNGDGDVDTDHPDLDLALEAPCERAVAGEQRGSIPVGVGVDQIESLLERRHSYHAEDRSEDLV